MRAIFGLHKLMTCSIWEAQETGTTAQNFIDAVTEEGWRLAGTFCRMLG